MRFEHKGGCDWVGSIAQEQLVFCGRDVSVAEASVAEFKLLFGGVLKGTAQFIRGVVIVEDRFRIGVKVGGDREGCEGPKNCGSNQHLGEEKQHFTSVVYRLASTFLCSRFACDLMIDVRVL